MLRVLHPRLRFIEPQLPSLVPLLAGIAGTFAASLAVYGIVRAIGWVIGGFVAS
jgi:hypothetical protein